MKNKCDIVKDLLFSYNDGVLSKTSKDFVAGHLKNCKNCKNFLEEIRSEIEIKDSLKDVDFLKKISNKISNKNIIIIITILLLSILILLNILVFKNYNEVASTMKIYLEDNITDSELENIKKQLMKSDANIEFEYISKEVELKNFKNNLGNNSYLLDGFSDTNNPLPASFSIKTSDIQVVVDNIQNMPGIAHIVTYLNHNPYSLFVSQIFKD